MVKASAKKNPKAQLDKFLDRYSPEIAKLARAILSKMRKRLPGAIELVYDNYNALAIGFGPSEGAGGVIFSIAVYPRWISLFIFSGANLSDPEKLLKGSGSRVRHIVLASAQMLDTPEIRALMEQALKKSGYPIDPKLKNRIVIKSISAKQRPRRP